MSHVNAFAIDHADGGIVLVDTGGAGHPSAWETLEHVLGLAGRSVSDIREIVVTHFHSDHVGLAGPLAAESGATVWAHPAREHLFDAIEEPDAVYARRLAFARAEGVPEEWQDAVASIAEELDGVEAVPRGDRELVDGVTVDTALGAFEVIETPGHAPSHVVLYQPERRLLFSADIVSPVFTTYGDWGYSEDPIGEYRAVARARRRARRRPRTPRPRPPDRAPLRPPRPLPHRLRAAPGRGHVRPRRRRLGGVTGGLRAAAPSPRSPCGTSTRPPAT